MMKRPPSASHNLRNPTAWARVVKIATMTVANAAEASKSMAESKKSNGLGGGAEIPHSAGKAKGQRAMAVAKIYPDTEQGKRKTSLETKQVGVSKTNLSFARTVLQYAPDLADNVLTGSPRFPPRELPESVREVLRTGKDSPRPAPGPPVPDLASAGTLESPGRRSPRSAALARPAASPRVNGYTDMAGYCPTTVKS